MSVEYKSIGMDLHDEAVIEQIMDEHHRETNKVKDMISYVNDLIRHAWLMGKNQT